ncbi:hypothetical protein GCM10010435_16290 [Winogradskya consettensis]
MYSVLLVASAYTVVDVDAGGDWAFLPGFVIQLALWGAGVMVAALRFQEVTLSRTAVWIAIFMGLPMIVTTVVGAGWYVRYAGERTAVVVTDTRTHCTAENECGRESRITAVADGRDLGWISPFCDFGGSVRRGQQATVWALPGNSPQPRYTQCSGQAITAAVAGGVWVVMAGGVIAARTVTSPGGVPVGRCGPVR